MSDKYLNMQKLAALEAEQQKLREEERKELEAQIAKVKNDVTIDSNAKQQKITELTNKLAQMERDYQNQLAGQKAALEAEIAKVRNDANTSLADKDRKIAELNKQIADNIAKAKAACGGGAGSVWVGGGPANKDYARLKSVWDESTQTCKYELYCVGQC